MVVGITGGIGSGKSTVLKYINENYNVKILLTDDIAKELMQPGNISYKLIIEYFGNEILKENEIDSNLLGKIVFNDKNKLEKLNSFTHPYVINYVEDYIFKNKQDIIFVESALLMETKLKDLCDKIIYVNTNLEIRKERLKSGRGYTEQKISQVLNNQKNNYTNNMYIVNNNSYDEMILDVNKFMKGLVKG